LAAVVVPGLDRDRVHRTALQLFRAGRAETIKTAEEALAGLVLQVDVGGGLERDPGAQAALLTVVNAGARAFLGGVRVRVSKDVVLSEGWARGHTVSESVRMLGGEIVRVHESVHPTIVVGMPPASPAIGSIVCVAACSGWTGGVLQPGTEAPRSPGIAPAGILAGGIAVSECFQHCGGAVEAGRREAGLSLWAPDTPWLEAAASGPPLTYLPDRLWLLGLGHLGQANAWTLGMLPYATGAGAHVFLLDNDEIVPGNLATGLLANDGNVRQMKTRAVAAALEDIGLQTRIIERLFDEHTWLAGDEPRLALAGFDSPIARRQLGDKRFERVVDAGLGGGVEEYLDILLHTFPSQLDPVTAFAGEPREAASFHPRFAEEVARLVGSGADPTATQCGMAEIAGITVGAAFVGATAAALTVGDVLRWLHGGAELSVLTFDLRTPTVVIAAENTTPGPYTNTGFVRAASRAT
jgi:hypothetical protein